MYFTSGSDRAFEQLMQTRPGADHFDNGEAGAPEDCGTCRFYRPHWKYQFCVYEECPYQPGKLTALDGAVKFQVKGVDDEMAVFRVEKNRGYTVMSNHHLRNKDLSLKAKGLLSQMLSLPEDWDFTLKGLSLINREQIDAIRAAVRELEQAGYIVRSRERDSQGRLRGADYIIYEQPQPVPDSPTLENPTLDNPTQEKPTQEKPTQLNKDRSSKEKSITDGSNTDSIPILSPPSPLGEEAAAPPERKGTGAKSQSAVEIYREIIKDNIEYEHLCQYAKGIDRDMLDEIVDLLVETVCSARKTIRIAGDDYPAELVKSKLMKRHKGLCHPRPAGKPYQDGGNVHRAELQHDRRHDEQCPVYGGTGSKGKSRGTDFPFGCGRGSQGGGPKAQADPQDDAETKETVHPGAACRRQGGTEKEAPGAGKIKRNGGMRNVFHRGRRKPDLSVPQCRPPQDGGKFPGSFAGHGQGNGGAGLPDRQ